MPDNFWMIFGILSLFATFFQLFFNFFFSTFFSTFFKLFSTFFSIFFNFFQLFFNFFQLFSTFFHLFITFWYFIWTFWHYITYVFWKNAWQFLDDFWYFEPHMHHEKMRYSPISFWMYEIRLRNTVNVYFKYNHCIQFQRKKGMNMHERHFGQKEIYSETFQKNVSRNGSQMTWNGLKRQENVSWKWFFFSSKNVIFGWFLAFSNLMCTIK